MSSDKNVLPQDIIAFWRAAGPTKWFTKDEAFDLECRRLFLSVYHAAAAGELAAWENSPEGTLALLVLLDQMPRNMFRASPRAYATDPLALATAERALARGYDQKFVPPERGFFYLPFMHSEHLPDQERCVALYRAARDDYGLTFAEDHADIVRRFGRFPHRNAVLGRTTTEEEQTFLDAGGFAG
jgi:uncharacterized protein (DUF924 family)